MLSYQKKFLDIFLIIIFGFLFSAQPVTLAVDEVRIEVSQAASASSIGASVQAGSPSSDFNIIKINNTSAFSVTINTIKVTRSGGSDADFDSVSLYYVSPAGSRSQLGSTQYSIASGIVYFDTGLTILANSSSTVAVTAAVASSAKAGDVVTWGLSPASDIGASVVGSSAQPTFSGTATGVSRTILGTGRDTTPPAAPSNIKIEPTGSVPTLKVSWDDPADSDLDKIILYRSTVLGQVGSVINSFNRGFGIVPVKTYNDTNIVAGTTYYYTVKAADFIGNESTGTTQYSGYAYPKGLSMALDSSSPAAGNITASSTNVSLAAFKFYVANVDAEITNLKIDGLADAGGNKNLDQLSFISLYVDGTFIASTTGPTFLFYNHEEKLIIPANSSKIISLRANIPSTSKNGATITLKIASLNAQEPSWYPVTITGLATNGVGNKLTITGGITVASPSPVPSFSPAPSSVSTAGIPEGALIRAVGDFDVYIVKYIGAKKFKRLVLSPSVFNNYGHLKWSDIRDVDPSIVSAFTTSELVRAVGDERVYKLYPAGDSGQKRWVTTAAAFSRLGFDADSIYEINSFDRDSYAAGSNLE